MTSKTAKTIYVCNACDSQFPKWQGRCPECGKWGTLEKQEQAIISRPANPRGASLNKVETLSEIGAGSERRLATGIREFDRVVGGGIVAGSVLLLGGDPGIGKSTLILQLAGKLAERDSQVLYISGEESATQVKTRFDRLQLTTANLKFLGETDVDAIVAAIDQVRPHLVIVDSIQTAQSGAVESPPGSVSQVKSVTARLVEVAKELGVPIVLIGHVTKEGNVAGPRTLEHLVDVVLYMEGDRFHAFRVLRAVKNRYGATSEVGVFDMRADGLQEVANPSKIFLAERQTTNPGSVVTAVVEGSRTFLVEVQALVNRTNFGYPQRRAAGFDYTRLQLLVAVLMRKAGLFLSNQDVHVNIAGGFKVSEPAADLAVCLAIASAMKNKPVSPQMAVFGEVGLGGELRAVSFTEKRLEEIRKMGFTEVVVPPLRLPTVPEGLRLVQGKTIGEVIQDVVV